MSNSLENSPRKGTALISAEQVEFGRHILTRLKNFYDAEEMKKSEHTFGFASPEGRITEAVIVPAVPTYERTMQEKSGLFLLSRSEVNLGSVPEGNL